MNSFWTGFEKQAARALDKWIKATKAMYPTTSFRKIPTASGREFKFVRSGHPPQSVKAMVSKAREVYSPAPPQQSFRDLSRSEVSRLLKKKRAARAKEKLKSPPKRPQAANPGSNKSPAKVESMEEFLRRGGKKTRLTSGVDARAELRAALEKRLGKEEADKALKKANYRDFWIWKRYV